MLTAAQRKQRARLGGLTLAATHDPMAYTSKARSTFLQRFEAGIDPDLPEAERTRRIAAARRLYFTRLSLASSRARGVAS